MKESVKSGIHPSAETRIKGDFSRDEKQIIKRWSELWYITRAGKIEIANSEYKFAYAKPTQTMEEGTGISKELVIIFSPYSPFDARSLTVYDAVVKEDIDQRYEKLCYVLISKDCNIETEIAEYVSGEDNQIVVPFSYDSLMSNKTDNYLIRNQLRKYFFARDLFDYSEPLKHDYSFFGRSDIVTGIISKHKAGQNMGIFGLRKTGKTSIIYDVIRKSNPQDFIAVCIDCQNPSFNNRRWFEALYYVIDSIAKENDVDLNVSEKEFSEKDAATQFNNSIIKIHQRVEKTILIMFDEIENITYGKSPVDHWCEGLDFVFFWQSIRSSYQNFSKVFTFCIFGTNPRCVELATINDKDNPIFNMISPTYISGFSLEQTREMVRKLGRIMGMRFDETIYGKMVEDYGGHPFLIRRVCSKISQLYQDRPVDIDRNKYKKAKTAFNIENTYFDMILNVLTQFYSDEYEMLKLLAIGDIKTFQYFVTADPSMVSHLKGYGIVKESDEGVYDFKIDAIKDYIVRLNNEHIKPETANEKWKQLCSQRNDIETRTRKMVRNILRMSYKTEADAKAYVVNKVFRNNKKLLVLSYNDLFNSRKNNIYLKDLFTLIKANWESFSDFFGKQDVFNSHMMILNSEGRFDAHSTVPNDSEISAVDNAIQYFDNAIKKYESAMA